MYAIHALFFNCSKKFFPTIDYFIDIECVYIEAQSAIGSTLE